ncbi:MAG: MerR family transcriptional regulator [Propionicimonas sp.]|nr:MerR family transcriptional regulator [Propionicimonas sp.]MBU3977554.1 MerR family transcriptional regulator [Actinomycetota bacterium]MBA3021479.1 MerR family DNA-binding transcriptional regulator [Propionicimonas sp.]MBU3987028.1 MerR family transcriptional regulator [Actinomycetota bacterium]MBU4008849.1 MerR family transcriptional regulator [Actinomycetota bacterium]MBU4066001.1 MerR family transcriptional regulator [Actinomycetota bacterium]
MDHENGLLQIGVFSRLSRISVRMLRHYAEHGLLAPEWVDPASGYRHYGVDQLGTAERIVGLRDAGIGVAEMAALLPLFDDPTTLSAPLLAHRHQLLQSQDQVRQRLSALDRLVHQLEEQKMTIEVHTTKMPAMTIAAVRDVIGNYADEPQLWERLMPQLLANLVDLTGIGGATFHDEDYQDTDVDVEVWLQIPEEFPTTAPVTCREVPEQEVVLATLHGNYEGMSQVSAALGAHVAENGLSVGPMFNIYRVSPAQDPDPANWVTDVCLPIIARAS